MIFLVTKETRTFLRNIVKFVSSCREEGKQYIFVPFKGGYISKFTNKDY